MKWLLYLMEANLYLIILYVLYKVVLESETFYKLNRYYLLMTLALSLSLPFLQLERRVAAEQHQVLSGNNTSSNVVVQDKQALIPMQSGSRLSPLQMLSEFKTHLLDNSKTPQAIFYAYSLIALFFLIPTLFGVYKIVVLYYTSQRQHKDGIAHVILKNEYEPFSFFNWLFYNPAIPYVNTVIAHELVHIRQKHSLDILFSELVRIISWLNPAVHLLQRDMKLNHEYIADEIAAAEMSNRHQYALLLIDNACPVVTNTLTHTLFNAEQLKARIYKLGKTKSSNHRLLKYLLLIPLLAGITIMSACIVSKEYGFIKVPSTLKSRNQVVQNGKDERDLQIASYQSKNPIDYSTAKSVISRNVPNEPGNSLITPKSIERTGKIASKSARQVRSSVFKNLQTLSISPSGQSLIEKTPIIPELIMKRDTVYEIPRIKEVRVDAPVD